MKGIVPIIVVNVVVLGLAAGLYLGLQNSPSETSGQSKLPDDATKKVSQQSGETPGSAKQEGDRKHLKDDDLLNQPHDVDPGFKPDPAYMVDPVANEPAVADDEEMRALEKEGKVKGVQFFPTGGWVKYTGDDRKIVLPGVINMRRGMIEYFMCAENSGKEHETVVEIACDPSKLLIAMSFMALKKGPPPKSLSLDEKSQGDRAIVLIQWKKADGTVVTHAAEDFLIDATTGKTMPRVGWTFTGSYFAKYTDPDTGKENSFFVASAEKLIISAFRNPSCLLDSPIPEAAQDPPIFDPNPSVIPPVGTPISIIIRSPGENEWKEIVKIEKEYIKGKDKPKETPK